MKYQSFGNIVGSSNSEKKYDCMKLNALKIKDKVCLDIGCNEGFFCHKLSQLGAKEVVGVDFNKGTIVAAEERAKGTGYNINYVHADINNYTTTKKYDVILISSALHYMDAFNVFPKIVSMMNPEGIFVFEGGIIMDNPENSWVIVKRSRDIVTHPTRTAFEYLSQKYFKKSVLIGKSTLRLGDPIDRYVYHCYL
jgi:2-polyprenyl-3-methyl-5-hydroxy-6-metoxy-1,4-benzoquinol methylase